jgi:C1A family cysteine protease
MSPPLNPKGLKLGNPPTGTRMSPDALDRWAAHQNKIGMNNHGEVLFPEYTPISSQGGIGTCVANAMCDGLEILQGLFYGPDGVVQLSRLALYYWSRCRHQGQHEDEGTFPEEAAQQLLHLGVLRESSWPYDEDKVNVAPPGHKIIEASNNRIMGAHTLVETGEDLADACEKILRSGNVVVPSLRITRENFQNPSGVIEEAKGDVWGNHAVLITGVRILHSGKREFRIRNSWGEDWGDGGRVYVSEGYLRSATIRALMLTLKHGLVIR